jgi:hypothetical protein
MAFELRLTFSGLTALLPRKEAGKKDPATEWLVVMPALRKGELLKLEKGKREFSIAPHQAVLLANARAVREESTTKLVRLRIRDPRTEPDDKQSDLLFQLDREVVKIATGAPGLQVRSSAPPALEIPDVGNPDQLHDIKWVPPIDECNDGGVPFDRSLFDPEKLTPDKRLAAVVLLDRGRLETTDVHRGSKNKPVPYEFRKTSPEGPLRFRQALSTEFRLRVRVDGDEARLELTDHGGNKKQLVVKPYLGCPTNEDNEPYVEVKVYNRELEEILGLAVDPNLPERGDTDFVIFYRLSPVWNGLSDDDVALPYRKGEGGGGRTKPCEPPIYPGVG